MLRALTFTLTLLAAPVPAQTEAAPGRQSYLKRNPLHETAFEGLVHEAVDVGALEQVELGYAARLERDGGDEVARILLARLRARDPRFSRKSSTTLSWSSTYPLSATTPKSHLSHAEEHNRQKTVRTPVHLASVPARGVVGRQRTEMFKDSSCRGAVGDGCDQLARGAAAWKDQNVYREYATRPSRARKAVMLHLRSP